MRTILSLFDYTGNWSKPYRERGYNVIQIDIKLGTDLFSIDEEWFGQKHAMEPDCVWGILAALPCTDFAGLGARHWAGKDADGRTAESVRLAYKTLEIIELCNPEWWVLENPVGRLNRLVPELAAFGPRYFHPYEFGDPYTKKTGLWGQFSFPTKSPVLPHRESTGQSWIHARLGGKSERTKELRSTTPMGFAYAFQRANP